MRVQQTLPPTFLFLQYSIFKEPTPQTQCRGPCRFWLRPGRVSLTRLSWISSRAISRSELLGRQRRAALVGEAYIVGGLSGCQHRIRSFLNFLRRFLRTQGKLSSLPPDQPRNPFERRHVEAASANADMVSACRKVNGLACLATPQRSPIAAPLAVEHLLPSCGDAPCGGCRRKMERASPMIGAGLR